MVITGMLTEIRKTHGKSERMKILIAQAKRTNDIELLTRHLENSECDLIVFPEGYISNE